MIDVFHSSDQYLTKFRSADVAADLESCPTQCVVNCKKEEIVLQSIGEVVYGDEEEDEV